MTDHPLSLYPPLLGTILILLLCVTLIALAFVVFKHCVSEIVIMM